MHLRYKDFFSFCLSSALMTSIPAAHVTPAQQHRTAGLYLQAGGNPSATPKAALPNHSLSAPFPQEAPDRCRQLDGRALALFPPPVFNHVLKGQQKQTRTKGRGASPPHAAEGRPCWLLAELSTGRPSCGSGHTAVPIQGCHLLHAAKESAGLSGKGPYSPSDSTPVGWLPPPSSDCPGSIRGHEHPPTALGSTATTSSPAWGRQGQCQLGATCHPP